MNNRQAGAFREMIRKEEKSRESWLRENGARFGLTAGPDGEPVPDPNMGMPPQPQMERPPSQRRTVDVPYMRQVKVPVKTQRMVPVRVQKKIPTKRIMEVPGFKEVEETYTTIEERPAVRKKEIWVKKIVPERYIKRTEIPRTRKIRVPHKMMREVDDYSVVDAVEHRPMEVEGYRIDEIESVRAMDEQEFQMYGSPGMGFSGQRGTRRMGNEVYHPEDERVRNLPVSYPAQATEQRAISRSGRIGKAGSQIIRKGSAKKKRGAPKLDSSIRKRAPPAKIGMRLVDSEAQGCLVQRVEPGGASEAAGIRVHDIVMYVNNRPTRSLKEFRAVASDNNGPLYLQVIRRGAGKLKLTVIR